MRPTDGPDSWDASSPLGRPSVDLGSPGDLASSSHLRARLEHGLGAVGLLGAVAPLLGEELEAERFEVHWRAAGLGRPGVIAHLTWPRWSTRLGLGIEPPLAHALVDRLLGFDRLPAEGRLQVTPVEWGILSFVLARALGRLDESPGPFGAWDLALDRVGPEAFDPVGLGPIVTWRWRIRLGQAVASSRLWLPESLLAAWLADDPLGDMEPRPPGPDGDRTGEWKAEAGSITMTRGLARLRPGLLLLIDGSPMSGTPASPDGPIELARDGPGARSSFRARVLPDSHATRLILDSPLQRDPRLREVRDAGQGLRPAPNSTADAPVTLTVGLGRVSLPADRLADLKPGDVLELGRDPKEPIELTAGGRLVARGELVQVDTELGVRVTRLVS